MNLGEVALTKSELGKFTQLTHLCDLNLNIYSILPHLPKYVKATFHYSGGRMGYVGGWMELNLDKEVKIYITRHLLQLHYKSSRTINQEGFSVWVSKITKGEKVGNFFRIVEAVKKYPTVNFSGEFLKRLVNRKLKGDIDKIITANILAGKAIATS